LTSQIQLVPAKTANIAQSPRARATHTQRMNQSKRSEGYAHAPGTIRLGDLEVQRMGYGAMRLPGKKFGESPPIRRARARCCAER
jgi:hypothetical protein